MCSRQEGKKCIKEPRKPAEKARYQSVSSISFTLHSLFGTKSSLIDSITLPFFSNPQKCVSPLSPCPPSWVSLPPLPMRLPGARTRLLPKPFSLLLRPTATFSAVQLSSELRLALQLPLPLDRRAWAQLLLVSLAVLPR